MNKLVTLFVQGQKDLRTMLLGRAATSGSSSSSSHKEVDNALITENEFKELFPEGYNITTLFAKPKEYWAMNKGKLEKIFHKYSTA